MSPLARGFSRGLVLIFALTVSASGAAQRLPASAIPEHYDLTLAPDLEGEQFAGDARITMHVVAPTARFVLNAVDLTVTQASVTAAGLEQAATVTLDPDAQTLTLTVPKPVSAERATLRMVYSGRLKRDLRGFYLSEAHGRKYAVTQLEATDARRMFPSFDEPRYKATFDVHAIVDANDVAISNPSGIPSRALPVNRWIASCAASWAARVCRSSRSTHCARPINSA